MPRRPRIDQIGYYHIINRGVERRNVFHNHGDYTTFLDFICEASTQFGAKLHGYALMPNHYHLLLK